MEITNSSGPLNEYFPESNFCATPDGIGNGNICPEDEVTSPVVVSKRSRKDGRLNLGKSLTWNPAFFTEEGVLNPSELSVITGSVTKPSSKLLSKNNVESLQFDKFSKRPRPNNLEEVFLNKVQARSTSRSSNKKAANLLSISEESAHDGPQMSMTLRKTPSLKGITKNVPKLDVAYLMLKKVKTAKVQTEKDTSILKLNSCPSSSNRSQMVMNCSAPTGMMFSVTEKAHHFCGLPPAPIQAKQSALRMPSPHGRLEKAKTSQPLFKNDPRLEKAKTSPVTPPMETTCYGSTGLISSISQQTFNVPGLPPPIQAKPSALRMPSPSLGFFQQTMVTSSLSDQLHKTSEVPISNIPNLRRSANLKHTTPSKHPVSQTEQQPKKAAVPTKTNVYLRNSRRTEIILTANGSNLARADFEAHTESTEIKNFDAKGTISSNVCGSSNCLSDVAKEIMTDCLSVSHKMDEKTREVLLGKPYTGRAKEFPEDNCSSSQISSMTLTEESGMTGKVLHSNGFENTSGSRQYSIGSITAEICPTSSEMHFRQNLDESNSKLLYVRAPVMTGDLVMDKDVGDETYADTSMETLPCITTVCGASEEAGLHIEPRKEPTAQGGGQNGGYFHKTNSPVQQAIPGKSQTGKQRANSSQDAQLAISEEYQPHDDLQLCESRNETSSVEENGLMLAKKLSLDNLKHDAVLLKHHLSAVPYSEEWLAAIESFGEDILEVKTGTVHNSPPDKAIPEPGPWSPVKRKAQDVGPFDCTKYSKNPAPWEE